MLQLFKEDGNNQDFKDYLKHKARKHKNIEDEKSEKKDSGTQTIFDRFLEMVNAVLNIFEAQPLRESPELTKIEKKYPKYIPSFSLLRLQF